MIRQDTIKAKSFRWTMSERGNLTKACTYCNPCVPIGSFSVWNL